MGLPFKINGSGGALDKCPTYKKDVLRRWSEWLQAKYGSQDGLAKAWGNSLGKAETLEAKNISMVTNPWFMGPAMPPAGARLP